MATRAKIKISDNNTLRTEIDELIDSLNQIDLAKWAIQCAKHILHYSDSEFPANETVINGLLTNELWQKGDATVHEVRQAGFKVQAIARQCKTELAKTAIRTTGQAIGVGHMKEHAMVCSDYAIKTIQIAFPDNKDKITEERQWQLNELKSFLKR
jgi:hypothetical protein